MSEKNTTKKLRRSRNWLMIVYPDSAPENWRELIDNQHVEWVESPLHDMDVNDVTGEMKKPHYHILVMFGGLKSYEQVKDILSPLNGTVPQICQNCKSSIRYFAHLDNPEKYQYDFSKIIAHGGVDLQNLLKPTSAERYQLIAEMIDFVNKNGIYEYCDLMDYAIAERYDDWFPVLCDTSTIVLKEYIKSRYFKYNQSDRGCE